MSTTPSSFYRGWRFVTFAQAWGSITFSAHLYDALRQEKLLNEHWTDMELLFSVQNEEHLLVGNRPNTAEQYFRRFCLTMGYSASNFARNRRAHAQAAVSASGPRTLEERAPVSRLLVQKYVYGVATGDMTIQDVETILNSSNWPQVEDSDEESSLVVERQTNAEKKSGLKKRWDAKNQVSMVDLLRTLRLSLQAEIMEFSFDYFLMHRQCWRLLRAIKEATQSRMTEIFGQGYLEKENQLPFLVGYIFMQMAQDEKLAKKVGLRLPTSPFRLASRELLEAASEVLASMISTDAGQLGTMILQSVYNVGFENRR